MDAGELDGVIIAEGERSDLTKAVIRICKLYGIPKVGVFNADNVFDPIFILNPDKTYVPYLETNLIDGCNLNCKGCTHFSSLFSRNEIYPLETFRRDVRRLSEMCDIVKFRLLGGEPLLLKNLDQYIKISREYLPKTNLKIVTNGLLIPTLPQEILDTIRDNHCIIDISAYAPTIKIAEKIQKILRSNKIAFYLSNYTKDKFKVFLTLHGNNDLGKVLAACGSSHCRFLRNGKIYKCPEDALSYRLMEKFGVDGFPKATGVDLYAPNFSSILERLEDDIEMCHWCGEERRQIPWEISNKPKLEDWLADPEEIKKFQ